jgi:hypothetical protein
MQRPNDEQVNEQQQQAKRRRVSNEPGVVAPTPKSLPSATTNPVIAQKNNITAVAKVSPPSDPARTGPQRNYAIKLLLDLRSDDLTVVTETIKKLPKLFISNQNSDAAHAAGAMTIIVSAMRKWQDVRGIQEDGLACMANLMQYNWYIKSAFWKSSGLQAVLTAMKQFPNSKVIQFFGVYTLYSFFDCLEEEFTMTLNITYIAHYFVNKLHGVPFLLRAMKMITKRANFQGWCCSVLLVLYESDTTLKHFFRTCGALPAVRAALKQHPGVDCVESKGEAFVLFVTSYYSY